MTFFDYYKNLPDLRHKRVFRKNIIEACKIEPGTFYTWLNRGTVSLLAQSIITEIIGLPQDELFPRNEETLLFRDVTK
jgi:hypothetical protein